MECDRFKKLVRNWYVQVQNEALAPARMVSLMKQHVADCRICQNDSSIRQEVDKITEIILPPVKAKPQTVKAEPEKAEKEPSATEPEEEVTGEEIEEEIEIQGEEEEQIEEEEDEI